MEFTQRQIPAPHKTELSMVRTVLKWNSLSSEVVSSPTLEATNLLGIL